MIRNVIKNFNELLISLYVIAIIVLLSLFELGRIGTLVLIPLGSLYFFSVRKRISKYVFNTKAVQWYVIFITLSSFSILYSIDPLAAVSTQLKMIIVFVFSVTIFSYCIVSLRNVHVIYFTNALTLFMLFLYTYIIGFELGTDTRLNEGGFNANTYGYFIFLGLHSLFSLYNIKRSKTKKLLLLILILIACFLSFMLTLASASRGALLISFCLIIGNFLILSKFNKKGVLSKLLFLIFFCGTLFYTLQYAYNYYFDNSILQSRFDLLEVKQTTREFHLRKAIEIGFENPILGVGSGNYAIVPKAVEQGSFSHNTFAEIFANFGFLGLIVISGFFLSIFSKLRRLLKFKNETIKVSLYQISLFLILFLAYNTLYVFYLSTIFFHFLFVVYAHLILIERTIHQNNNIK